MLSQTIFLPSMGHFPAGCGSPSNCCGMSAPSWPLAGIRHLLDTQIFQEYSVECCVGCVPEEDHEKEGSLKGWYPVHKSASIRVSLHECSFRLHDGGSAFYTPSISQPFLPQLFLMPCLGPAPKSGFGFYFSRIGS